MRPITTSFSGLGGLWLLLLAKLPDQPRCSVGQDRPLRLPVRQALAVYAQALAPFRGLGIVKADALDEAAIACAARVGNHHIEERAFLGAAARESNDNHICLRTPKVRKGRDFTPVFRREARQK